MTDYGSEIPEVEPVRRAPRGTSARGSSIRPSRSPAKSPAKGPAKSPAKSSKVAATGLGLATMFGLVGAMAIGSQQGSKAVIATSEPRTVQMVPVAPSVPASVPPPTGATEAAGPAAHPTAPVPGTDAAAAVTTRRVVLNARPTVRPVPVTEAPAVRTNGSR